MMLFSRSFGKFPRRPEKKNTGVALIITLSLLLLVTIAAMAFFERATANRKTENARANQVLVSQVAQSAENYVIGQFLQEIKNNSTNVGSETNPVYQPSGPANMVPQRLVASGNTIADFPTLVRQSIPTSTPPGDPSASTDNTATASANGRSIKPERWNAPRFHLGATGFSSAGQTPNWIYLQKDGTTKATPDGETIGRFAYNVYETGGLLDANVAGHPGLTGTALQEIKGTLAGADLTALGGSTTQAAITNLVTFRDPGATAANYAARVKAAAATGFLAPVVNVGGTPVTLNRFQTRQDLIRYATKVNSGLANALPYLTHTSRVSNVPAWGPQTNAGGSFNYQTNANNPSAINRFLPNVQVKAAFTRRDGSQAKVGEPLITSRFPLSKLAWIGKDGPVAPGTAATIQRDFGLVWDNPNKRWNYVGHTGSTVQTAIKTLDQVSTDNREPNFFELLKAGILSGSLGQGPEDNLGTIGMNWNPAYSRSLGNLSRHGKLADYQIIQIGANIIDQADTDSIPTALAFDTSVPAPFATGSFVAFGTENLPYVNKIFTRIFRPSPGYNLSGSLTQPPHRPYLRGWLAFELWNPHANASGTAPAMRIVQTAGSMSIFARRRRNSSNATIPNSSPYRDVTAGGRLSTPPTTSGTVTFTGGAAFATPTVLTSTNGNATSSTPQGAYKDTALNFDWTGFWLGDINEPDASIPGTLAAIAPYTANDITTRGRNEVGPSPTDNLTFDLQVDATGSGDWRTVQRLYGANHQTIIGRQSFYFFDYFNFDYTDTSRVCVSVGSHPLAFVDPRTSRFGMGVLTIPSSFRTGSPWDNATLRGGVNPTTDGRFLRRAGVVPFAAPNANPFTEMGYRFGALCENLSTSTVRVPDVDAVLRPGDGRLATAAGFDALGLSTSASSTKARPVILDRPFRSVGELGVVFRDQPWKTLDLFSSQSADSGLLDLFTAEDFDVSSQAGKINLNTAPPEVLQSVLVDSDTGFDAASLLNSSQASNLATGLKTALSSKALVHLSDLADANARVNDSAFPSSEIAAIKSRREVLARALAPLGQTRTWNLFIDLIVQSGRVPPGGGNFIVEGESRIWTSCALDRFNATISSSQNEIVTE